MEEADRGKRQKDRLKEEISTLKDETYRVTEEINRLKEEKNTGSEMSAKIAELHPINTSCTISDDTQSGNFIFGNQVCGDVGL